MLLFSWQARAAITVTNGTAAAQYGGSSLSLATPSGTASGDVLVAQISVAAGITITAPTGWSLVTSASTGSSNSNITQNIYYLNVSGTPASSYAWGIGGKSSQIAVGAMYAVHGANPADCASAATTNCAGAIQAGGGNQMAAPNIQSQPPTYPAQSIRMAFFGAANGDTYIGMNDSSATSGVGGRTGSGTNGVAINAEYYVMTSDSNGGSESAYLYYGYSAGNAGSTLILTVQMLNLTCFSDNFNRTTGLGTDWGSAVVNGSFTPAIVSNRLRMTDTKIQESTAVSLQRLFPADGNYVQMTFKYYGYGGSGADGMAVILSDSAYTPQPGGFGGSLGYAPKAATGAAGFAGGWMGLGLDEYGNFSNKNDSGACASSATTCQTSALAQSVSIRGSRDTYYLVTGTKTLSPTVSNSTGHLYRVTVDSRTNSTANPQAYVTVERDTTGAGTSYTTLINAFNIAGATGQKAIPSNFILSLTGSTGDATNTHEIDDLNVCAKYMNAMTTINHYRFSINTTPLTCTPAAVTVTACMDANCTTTYTADKVTATLTATTTSANGDDGWVGGSTQTFSSGSTLYLRESTAGTYTIGVSGSTPSLPAFSTATALCSINGSTYTAANCSAVTFADSGLLLTVPTQTSGVTSSGSSTFSVAAVKKSDSSLSCTPAFASTSRSVKFWSGYVSPSTGTKTLAVNGTAVGTSTAGATTQSLTFNSSGVATGLTLNYADAGQISLSAEYDGSATTIDRGLTMTGSSTFVVVPYKLCVDSTSAGWNCTASSANAQTPTNCSVFTSAGSPFNLRVTGKAYSAGVNDTCLLPTTLNYLQSAIPLASAVYAPTGGAAGSLSATSIDITASGTATVSTTESEVGVFTLSATPASGAYFGQTVPSGSNVFGRFVPYGIQITGALVNRGDLTCSPASTFTYLGEPVTARVSLSAVNKAGGVTSNYTGSFARLPVSAASSLTSTGLAFGAQSGTTPLNSRLTASCSSCGSFSSGAATISVPLTVARASTVDGPFPAAQFGLSVLDSDSVGVYSPDYNWDLTGAAEGKLLGTTALRFGRMRLENAYGSPLLKLNVPAYAQYWNGTSFQKNTDDSCTQITVPTSSTVTASTAAALYCSGGVGLYGTLAGVTASMNGVAAGSTATLASGDAGLWLSKPTNTGGGYLDVAPAVPAYLKYNWDGVATSCASSTGMFDDNPRARVRFGVPRNDKIIYLREVY
jgi:MSHA biogenesis protein MshQ